MGMFHKNSGTKEHKDMSTEKISEREYEAQQVRERIANTEDQMKKQFTKIGYDYYKLHKNEKANEFQERLDTITLLNIQRKEFQSQLDQLENVKTCSKCGMKIPGDAQFCHVCGQKVIDEMWETPKEEPPLENKRVCANCGQEAQEEDVFCAYCGERLSD